MNWKQTLWAFVALVLTLFVASPAFAMIGQRAEQDKNFWVVEGPDPDLTYIRVGTGDLNTPSLAEYFHTDFRSIRASNKRYTLALCRVTNRHGGEGLTHFPKRTSSDPQDVSFRTSDAGWEDCDDPYTYVVPGSTIVLTGRKYLSSAEQQAVFDKLYACRDEGCLRNTVAPFAPNVKLGSAPPPPAVSVPEPQPPPPAAPAAKQPSAEGAAPVLPAADPPPPPAEEAGETGWPFLGMTLLAAVAIILLIVQWRRANRAEQTATERFAPERKRLEEEIGRLNSRLSSETGDLKGLLDTGSRDIKSLRHRLEKLTEQVRSAVNALSGTFFKTGHTAVDSQPPGEGIEWLQAQLTTWYDEMFEALRAARTAVTTDAFETEDVMTPHFVRETTERMQASHADGQSAIAERSVLLERLHQLLMEFGSECDVDQSRQTLVAEDAVSVCGTLRDRLLAISRRIQQETSDLLHAVTGEGPRTVRMAFDTGALQDVFGALDGVYTRLETVLNPEGTRTAGEVSTTVLGRIHQACDLVGDLRKALKQYRDSFAEQQGEIAKLRSQLECDEASGVKPVPHEDVNPRHTLRPPSHSAVPPAPNGSWRSQLFGSIDAFLKRHEDHAVVPLDNIGESGLVIRLYQFLCRRRFQIPLETGSRTFSPSNPQEDPEVWGCLQRFGAVSLP